jgi:hypothetical protein
MMIGCSNPIWNRPIEERKEFLKKEHVIHVFFGIAMYVLILQILR